MLMQTADLSSSHQPHSAKDNNGKDDDDDDDDDGYDDDDDGDDDDDDVDDVCHLFGCPLTATGLFLPPSLPPVTF